MKASGNDGVGSMPAVLALCATSESVCTGR